MWLIINRFAKQLNSEKEGGEQSQWQLSAEICL